MTDLSANDHLGPIGYVAVEFPDGKVNSGGFRHLLDLAEAGSVLLLDVEFLRLNQSGALVPVVVNSLGLDVALTRYTDGDSGLLDRSDLQFLEDGLSPDSVLAVVVYEDRTLIPVISAWESSGGRLLAEGPVALEDLDEALGDDNADPEGR